MIRDNVSSSSERKKNKFLVILGAGKSGIGTALLAKAKGYKVFVSDMGSISPNNKNVLLKNDIEFEEKQHLASIIHKADLVMKSPGIPNTVPIVKKLRTQGIKIVSEIEFASVYTNAKLIAVTGSNGKTTSASWIHHILKQELCIGLAGNIGYSFAEQTNTLDYPNYVLEVSSFQLDDIDAFKPKIAVLTNITPDHLDRYDFKFEKYIGSKFRITKNQTASDYFIYDADDEGINAGLKEFNIKAKALPFSLRKKMEQGAYLEKNKIVITINNKQIVMPTEHLALKGNHNLKNAMAAATVAHILRIRKQTIRESLENFQGVEHRLEYVVKVNKVHYINDSKATNVNAAYFALQSMQAPTVWIVGGVDKGNDYKSLFPFVNEKVKAIICLGVNNEKIMATFKNMVDVIVETHLMTEAVTIAYKLAEAGDYVLLSPACASFDIFENYEDRGRQFKKAVRNL